MAAEAAPSEQKLRVVVDRASCCGYGACRDICPEVFQLENNLVRIMADVVPSGLEAKAQEAAEYCPQACILIEPVG